MTDNTVLSEHLSLGVQGNTGGARKRPEENQKTLLTQFVLGISNWHFVRDKTSEASKEISCSPSDIQIYIKLSSDCFRGNKGETQSRGDLDFCFDRNAACFSYVTLISLLRSEQFQKICQLAKSRYEKLEGPLLGPLASIDVSAELAAATAESPDGVGVQPLEVPSVDQPEKKGKKTRKRLIFQDSPPESDGDEAVGGAASSKQGRKRPGPGAFVE
jgi:hypothetical protein